MLSDIKQPHQIQTRYSIFKTLILKREAMLVFLHFQLQSTWVVLFIKSEIVARFQFFGYQTLNVLPVVSLKGMLDIISN